MTFFVADMTGIFDLIFDMFSKIFNILSDFSIQAYGFRFSLWDFFLFLFIVPYVLPLVISPADIDVVLDSASERIKEIKEDKESEGE